MNDHHNGQPADLATTPGPEAQKQIIENTTRGLRPVVQTMCQGMVVGWQQAVPAHVLMQLIAFELGFYMGYALTPATIADRVALRKQFQDAFADGLKKAPLTPSNWKPPEGETLNG